MDIDKLLELMHDDANIDKKYTWGDLKAFCNTLSEQQLKQSVTLCCEDELSIEVGYASEVGEDSYYFPESEYCTTKKDYAPEYMDGKDFEVALVTEEYMFTPATNVYLFEKI